MLVVKPFDRRLKAKRNQQADGDRRNVNYKILPRMDGLVRSVNIELRR